MNTLTVQNTKSKLGNEKGYVKLSGDFVFRTKGKNNVGAVLRDSIKEELVVMEENKSTAYEQFAKINEIAKYYGLTVQENGSLKTNFDNAYGQKVEFSVQIDQFGKNHLVGCAELIIFCVNHKLELTIQNPWENNGVWMTIKTFSEKELLNLSEASKVFLESSNNFESKDLGILQLSKENGTLTRTFVKCAYKQNNPYFSFFLRGREAIEGDVEEYFRAEELITIEDLLRYENNTFVQKIEEIVKNAEHKEEVFEIFLTSMLKNKSKYAETLMFLFLPIVFKFLGQFYFPM